MGGVSVLDGEEVYCGDMSVILDGDVVRVEEIKKVKSVREFFARTN